MVSEASGGREKPKAPTPPEPDIRAGALHSRGLQITQVLDMVNTLTPVAGRSGLFRALSGVACLIGLAVPVLGANPIAAQVSQVFVLPLVVAAFMALVNRRPLMGEHRAGPLLNAAMAIALLFSLVMSCVAVRGLVDFFR